MVAIAMAKKRRLKKSVHLTKSDRDQLDRFGCAFKEKVGVLCIDWRAKSLDAASRVKIFARLSSLETKAGPLILLAVEISSVRPLPHYCYFPFDLKNLAHRYYLSHLTQTGEIKLRFLKQKQGVDRKHHLTPYLQSRSAEIFAEALQSLKSYGSTGYEYELALQVMERWVRIPEILDYRLLEDDIQELSVRIEAAVQDVTMENREFAKRIVTELVDALKPYYESNRKSLIPASHGVRQGSIYISDLYRVFANNASGLTEFLGNACAASLSHEELENLQEAAKITASLSRRFFQHESDQAPGESSDF